MPVRSYHTVNGKIRGSTQGGSVPLRTTYWHDAIGNVVATSNQYGVAKAAMRYSDYGAKTFDNSGWGAMRFGWIGGLGYRSLGPARSDVYVVARHYSSSEGRWTTAVAMHQMLGGETVYGYAVSNPITFVDPDGNAPRKWGTARPGRGPTCQCQPNPHILNYPTSGPAYSCLSRRCVSYCSMITDPESEAKKMCAYEGQAIRWNITFPTCNSGAAWEFCGRIFTDPSGSGFNGAYANMSNWPKAKPQCLGVTNIGSNLCQVECKMVVCCHLKKNNLLYAAYLRADFAACLLPHRGGRK